MIHQKFTRYLMVTVMLFMCQWYANAQAPNLPTKGTLSQTLFTGKSFSNGTAVDTVAKQQNMANEYTLEVVAKVNSATGRGLDIEARNAALKGYRFSLDATSLKSTFPLTTPKTISTTNAGEEQTIRIAVKNDSAHIYQNGAYLQSQPVATIKDIVNGAESDQPLNVVSGPNLIPNWAGTAPANTGTPGAYGWAYTGTTVTTLFTAANATSGVRYVDVTASANQHTYNGSAFVGRIMYIRWDNATYQSTVYSYPVTLEANTTYDFSMLYSLTANASPTKTITVGIGKTVNATDRFATKIFTSTATLKDLKRDDLYFTSQEAGVYYLTFTGEFALYSIAQLSLNKFVVNPRFIFGKNYAAGAVDMQISSATYEDGAYAPTTVITQPKQTVTLTGASVSVAPSFNTDFVVPGKTDAHFTGESTPFVNSTVALNTNDSWLFFDNVRPSSVIANWLSQVTINGAPAVNNGNVRIAVYKNGTVVIPNGNLTNNAALQVFTQPLLAGTSSTYPIQTIYNNLGTFNNAIRSFKLKRGYMATLANNADGSGFSRVFIANDSDLVIKNMPAGLDTTISFLRVMKWNWVSKKGKAGWDPGKINSTWYYDWNIGGASSPDYDYIGIRQNNGWPAYTDIINKGVNHISGFNEPDDANQSNLTVDQAFNSWAGIYQTGLRVGSPSPASPESSWITNFLAKTDSANYRVDYVTIHCYWGGQTPAQWYSRLLAIYNRVKRPLWITEWNNGANWTTETWPTDPSAQFLKNYNDMIGILNVLDTASFVERYAEYDWVQDKRALVLADTLTMAGKYYAASKSNFAYNPSYAYINNWKLVSPRLYSAIADTNYFKTTISWNDLNGELGSKYTLERKINGRDVDFVAVKDFTGYAANSGMSFVDSVYGKATYRLKAIGLDGVSFVYSGLLDVISDAAPIAPTSVTGSIISASKLKINWTAGTNVRSYNLKRSLSATGPFVTIAARTTALTFQDENLTPATTYYYIVTTLNTAGESGNSTVLAQTTPALVVPSATLNPRIASGDTKVTLTWDFMYDAKYVILRSQDQNGTYDTIAKNVDALRYEDLNRINTTTYYYKIVAFNDAGFGAESAKLTATPTFGQYLHIGFNENGGTMVKDDWGGYNGTLTNTIAWAGGKDSATGAVTMVKTAASYVQLPNGVASNLNDFTLASWFKMPSTQANNTRLFDFGNNTSNFMILIPWATTATGPNLRYKITCATGTNDFYIPYSLPLDTWVHVVLSQQGSTFKGYVNGVLQYTTTNATVKPSDLGLTTQNFLGKSQYSTDPYSDQTFDDFKIYDYAMSDQDVNNLYNGVALVLPVKLTSFEGKAIADGNLISWHTATETNNDHFTLERAFGTPANFEAIATIKGKGTTVTPSDYSFLDNNLKTGIYYYRLKQVNFDGTLEYSKTISIDTKSIIKLSVYPNPVSSLTTISLAGVGTAQIQVKVFNVVGRQVFEQKSNVLQSGSFQINLSELAAGAYQVQVSTGTSSYTVPIIKK